MKKRVINIVTGNGASFKFESRSDNFDAIKKEAEALLQEGEVIKAIEWLIFDVV